MKNEQTIGVVGGLGPYAGIDLVKKIFDQTKAKTDQEHLSVIVLSASSEVADRTAFLLDRTNENPAYAIVRIVRTLEQAGASVIGVPCYTAHMPPIFDVIREELAKAKSRAKLVSMVEEVERFVLEMYPAGKSIGLLCTNGTYKSVETASPHALKVTVPDKLVQDSVQDAIYNREYGIKARSNPATEAARNNLLRAVEHLRKKGVEAVVLGCTEIPLAITEPTVGGTLMFDPTLILARALIREANPAKLKPLTE